MSRVNRISKHLLPKQALSAKESGKVGKVVGQSKRKHFGSKIISGFILVMSSVGIASIVAIDVKLLAGSLGTTIWDQFGEGGLAIYIPLAMMMIAAFAHRLVGKKSDEDLKKSWLGRLVKKLATVLVLSIAVLFSATMFKNLYPAVSADSEAAGGWGRTADAARGFLEARAFELAAVLSPIAESAFALASGGILIITAFLLMLMMDWWYRAFKTLVVGQALHKLLLELYEEVKQLRSRYISIAATTNSLAAKSQQDLEMEFALFVVNQGMKSLAAQRADLSDRELKKRMKHPEWPEMDEEPLTEHPAAILQQRKEFARALNIDSILNMIRRTHA